MGLNQAYREIQSEGEQALAWVRSGENPEQVAEFIKDIDGYIRVRIEQDNPDISSLKGSLESLQSLATAGSAEAAFCLALLVEKAVPEGLGRELELFGTREERWELFESLLVRAQGLGHPNVYYYRFQYYCLGKKSEIAARDLFNGATETEQRAMLGWLEEYQHYPIPGHLHREFGPAPAEQPPAPLPPPPRPSGCCILC